MGPTRFGSSEEGYPVACARTVVNGDALIIADKDGVTVIAASRTQEVLDNIAGQQENEKELFRTIEGEVAEERKRPPLLPRDENVPHIP